MLTQNETTAIDGTLVAIDSPVIYTEDIISILQHKEVYEPKNHLGFMALLFFFFFSLIYISKQLKNAIKKDNKRG